MLTLDPIKYVKYGSNSHKNNSICNNNSNTNHGNEIAETHLRFFVVNVLFRKRVSFLKNFILTNKQ